MAEQQQSKMSCESDLIPTKPSSCQPQRHKRQQQLSFDQVFELINSSEIVSDDSGDDYCPSKDSDDSDTSDIDDPCDEVVDSVTDNPGRPSEMTPDPEPSESVKTYFDMVPVGIVVTPQTIPDDLTLPDNPPVPENDNNDVPYVEILNDGTRTTERLHKRTNKVLTRKRKRDPSTWKASIRKERRQKGLEYIDAKGKTQAARVPKATKDCKTCRYKCTINFTEEDRKNLFDDFWTLSDENKRHFYASTTRMTSCQRKRTDAANSRKSNSISYFLPLNNDNIRVCKTFYLNTLDISQTRINNFHASKTTASGTPTRFRWDGNQNRKLPEEIKEGIRQHIRSIPRVESHYCRNDTNKEYIAQWGLSVNALYQEYLKKCEDDDKVPGKLHLYRQIFNEEFNIAFHFPKSDRCDRCEMFKIMTEPTEEQIKAHDLHRKSKEETESERSADRSNKDAFVVCFDLENVFALPRANISSFYYKRKLNVYHMTAHCSVDGKAYGALWHEAQNSRSGNDIASSVLKLLEEIVKDHANDKRIENIILWSDSYVPQNRNRIFSTALKYFMSQHPEVKTVEQKFCEPGHSSIQEVDNLHSRIEKACGPNEMFSPVSLLRILKRVKSLRTIQMRPEHFRDFGELAAKGSFDRVPYTQVKSLKYKQTTPREIEYKTCFSGSWTTKTVIIKPKTRRETSTDISSDFFSNVKTAKPANPLSKEKKSDLKDMIKYMSGADKHYMSVFLK